MRGEVFGLFKHNDKIYERSSESGLLLPRRGFLKAAGAAVVGAGASMLGVGGLAIPIDAKAAPPVRPQLLGRDGPSIPKWPRPDEVRQIWLRRQSTGEAVVARYYDGESLVWDQYVACCTLLRDVQTGTVVRMDLELLDLIFAIQKWLVEWGIDRPMIINSGYRSPWTNSKEGGVRNSMHLKGKAVDFRIEGIPTSYLGRLAQIFGVGGVGFYLSRGFVHIDTGQVRQWSK